VCRGGWRGGEGMCVCLCVCVCVVFEGWMCGSVHVFMCVSILSWTVLCLQMPRLLLRRVCLLSVCVWGVWGRGVGVCGRVCLCWAVCMHVCVSVVSHARTHTLTHTHTRTRTHTHPRTHTHTHAHAHTREFWYELVTYLSVSPTAVASRTLRRL